MPQQQYTNNIRNIIAIASGKGGVGKSTVTVNLAYALRQKNYRVGILDADIYGPSIPILMNCPGQEVLIDSQTQMLKPIINPDNDIKLNSIAFLVPENTPIIWRGPMVSDAVQQLFNRTYWGDLDYLLIDLPPGTGDIQLTLAQKIPLTASIMVTQPQILSLLDVQKAIGMWRKLKIEILGVIENMAGFKCQHCDKISGYNAGPIQEFIKNNNLDLLGSLPMRPEIQQCADLGEMLLWQKLDFKNCVDKILAKIANLKLKFPRIKLKQENTN